MLRPDAGIVEPGRDRVRLHDLPVLVLQEVGAGAVQHPGLAAGDRGGVPAGLDPVSARLEADEAHRGVGYERREDADGIGAAADTSHQIIGQVPGLFQNLRPRFAPDHRLKILHHHRIRMRSHHGPDGEEGVFVIGDEIGEG